MYMTIIPPTVPWNLATGSGSDSYCHEYAQGKGNVIRRMFREIDAECYSYDRRRRPRILWIVPGRWWQRFWSIRRIWWWETAWSSTYFTENKRPFHNFGNSLMRAGINGLFHSDIKDIMTGYRAFSYEFVKTFPVFSKGLRSRDGR